jgi:DNA-binding NtrC family response regulator
VNRKISEDAANSLLRVIESLLVHNSLTEIAVILDMPIERLQAKLKQSQHDKAIEFHLAEQDAKLAYDLEQKNICSSNQNDLASLDTKNLVNSNMVNRFLHIVDQYHKQNFNSVFDAVKASDAELILQALKVSESRVEAAKKLGISPRTLRYKLAQLREQGMDLKIAG